MNQVLPQVPAGRPIRFAIFGDNQVYLFEPEPSFLGVVGTIREAAPDFVVMVGDAIYSETSDGETLRRKWAAYRGGLAGLACPTVQVPGNHDCFDEPSRALWRTMFGEPHFCWDAGDARFIVLDCESDPGRLDADQMAWLEVRMVDPGPPHVFIFVHRPLFPVVGHIGDSLDVDPAGRDRLHALFIRHRGRIRGVFSGHEHVFCHQDVDGVNYFHAAGGGAKLYAGPQQGGFHHALLGTVAGPTATVEVLRPAPPPVPVTPMRQVVSGTQLEQWTSGITWTTWDQSVEVRAKPGEATLHFNGRRYASPILSGSLRPGRDLGQATALSLSVRVPSDAPVGLALLVGLTGPGNLEWASRPASLSPGAHDLNIVLDGLVPALRANATDITLTLDVPRDAGPAAVTVGPIRLTTATGPVVLEDWNSGVLWYPWNDAIRVGAAPDGGLAVSFDTRSCIQPQIFAPLDPAWDLARIAALEVEALVAEGEALTFAIALDGPVRRCRAPFQPLPPGAASLRFRLDGGWLDDATRRSARRIELTLRGATPAGTGTVVFRSLRTA